MKKVLVVDDDAAILEVIKIILEESGYKVYVSENGNIKNKIAKFEPDLILLDVLLSGVDGRDIARGLKANRETSKIPIVMISAHPSASQGAKESGADEFIPKPFDVDHLLRVVEKYASA